MTCRVCLRKCIKKYYKLNGTYIDIIGKITGVQLPVNVPVCCFCLITLRKIQKFTKIVQEVDCIFKHSIKTEDNYFEVTNFNNNVLTISQTVNIKIEPSASQTPNCFNKEELLVLIDVNEEVQINDVFKDNPCPTTQQHNTGQKNKSQMYEVPLSTTTDSDCKNIERNAPTESDELCRSSDNNDVDHDTTLKDDDPLIDTADVRSTENEKKILLDDVIQDNDEPSQSSHNDDVDNNTRIKDDDPLIDTADVRSNENGGYLMEIQLDNSVQDNDEPCQSSDDDDIDNDTSLTVDDPLIDTADVRSTENGSYIMEIQLDNSIEDNDNPLLNEVHMSSRKEEEEGIGEQPLADVSKQNITSDENTETITKTQPIFNSNDNQIKNVFEILKLNNVQITRGSKEYFYCDICSQKYSKKGNLIRHLKTHSTIQSRLSLYTYKSKNKLTQIKNLQETKQYSCDQSSNIYSLNSQLQTQTNSLFTCDKCLYKCSLKKEFEIHIQTHASEKTFHCDKCHFKSYYRDNLLCHLKIHDKNKQFSCDKCPYKSARKRDFDVHVLKHTGEKPFSCTHCSFRTTTNKYLKLHLVQHTERVKSISCHICQFKTYTKNHLDKHLRTHTSVRAFACDLCPLRFKLKGNLREHYKYKHNNENIMSCHMCSYKTPYSKNLKLHIRTHTGEKPFSCDKCFYTSSSKNGLMAHVKKHTHIKKNIDDYLFCDRCSYKTFFKKNFKQHLETHSEKTFLCDICSYRTINRDRLNKHLTTHTGEKPFSCDSCSYQCNRKGNLVKHFKTHEVKSNKENRL